MVKKGCYGNEVLGLAWDRIKVCQNGLNITTYLNYANTAWYSTNKTYLKKEARH